MRVHFPILEVAASSNDHATPERLGGVPFGLAEADWPKCADCGKSQSLLAQLGHHSQRLDLGREGRMLLVFQCNHDPGMCATWELFSGANACIVVEPEALGDVESASPADAPPLENHVAIRTWRAGEDDIAEEVSGQFYSDSTYFSLSPELVAQVGYSTRLGGVPCWIQSPDEAPKPRWRFIGQLDSGYSFLEQPNNAASWVSADPEGYEGRTHFGAGPNFGDGGIAYLFLRDGAERPEGAMFWQCG